MPQVSAAQMRLAIYSPNHPMYRPRGYGMRRLDYPAAPLLFGFILGPMMEDHLRRALLIGGGDLTVLVGTQVSAAFHMASLAIVVVSSVSLLRRPIGTRLLAAIRERRP